MELNKEKLPIIRSELKKEGIDAWIIIGRETEVKSEPFLPVLGQISFTLTTSIIITQDQIYVIASTLDANSFRGVDGITTVIEYKNFDESIKELLDNLKPKTVGLNYSTTDSSADGLTYGYKLKLDRIFSKLNYTINIVSTSRIISKVRGIKTPNQISKIKYCAEVALNYMLRVPEILYEDSTSVDIFNFLHEEAYKDGFKMSWTESQCPGVSVDPNIPMGHGGIVLANVKKGYLINVDYGVAYDGYCSDLQRMFYVLEDNETDAPEHVKHAFYTVRDAIEQAVLFMKPGVTGYQVDKVARSHVVAEGYDSWNAALGHQVGHVTHDGGTLLANRRPRYNKKELIDVPLDLHNVFAVEPGVHIDRGRVGIEEDVVIEKDRAVFLVPPQQELILVRLKKR